ncbi:unnamed protein product, partial [Ilex paraguariensis]
RALSALGKKEDALLVWEQGYEYAVRQSADLKQLLELEELLAASKQHSSTFDKHAVELSGSSLPASGSVPFVSGKSSGTCDNDSKLNGTCELHTESRDAQEIHGKSNKRSGIHNASNGKVKGNKKLDSQANGPRDRQPNGTYDILDRLSDQSELCDDLCDATESYSKSAAISGGLSELSEICSKSSDRFVMRNELSNEGNGSKKFCVTRISKTKSINVDFRLSRGIAQLAAVEGENLTWLAFRKAFGDVGDTIPNGYGEVEGTFRWISDADQSLSDDWEVWRHRPSAFTRWSGHGVLIHVFTCMVMPNSVQSLLWSWRGCRIQKRDRKALDATPFFLKLIAYGCGFPCPGSIIVMKVNEGKYAHAISIFDQILKEDPTYPEALIGRGTAYAFQRELEAAIADFTNAIQSNPSAGEAWKRRGQARAALGESVEAIADLTKALEFEPNSADILHERGIVNFKFKDFNASVEDLSICVKLDQYNKSAYTYLGLALSSIGEYKRAEEAHMKSIQIDQKFLEAWAHLTQFYQDLANSGKALECLQQLLQIDGRFAKAYHLRGLLLHGMGEHRAILAVPFIRLDSKEENSVQKL